jgi:NAD(P)-dependent dehydrogenase (short-subunit alcohol dehydrogenase family)
MNKLKNKVAVITGGNSGIGLATAQAFIAEGAKVALFGRDAATLERAAEALGPNAVAVQGDVTRREDLERLYATAVQRFGKVDVVFANAGVAEFVPLANVDDAHYAKVMDINVKGVLLTVQAALPVLNDGASIILTTSGVNKIGMPGSSVYSATKAAVRSFARTFSAELVGRGIRVNALSPGYTETPIFGRLGMSEADVQALAANAIGEVPLKRFAQPSEMASVAVFLASSDSSFVVGAEIDVDGGQTQL